MALIHSQMLPIGTILPEFSLKNIDGSTIHSTGLKDKQGYLIMFICNHCPYVIHIGSFFKDIQTTMARHNIEVLAINSNDWQKYPEDNPEKMKEYADRYGFAFPYLLDESQDVAKKFQAACTPEFYLFDKDKQLYYRGRLDESSPGNGETLSGKDLFHAAELMQKGEDYDLDQYPSMGCNIKWKEGNAPSYFPQ